MLGLAEAELTALTELAVAAGWELVPQQCFGAAEQHCPVTFLSPPKGMAAGKVPGGDKTRPAVPN